MEQDRVVRATRSFLATFVVFAAWVLAGSLAYLAYQTAESMAAATVYGWYVPISLAVIFLTAWLVAYLTGAGSQ